MPIPSAERSPFVTTRTRTDLLALAAEYATRRRAPANTLVKEMLHYEIIYALIQSGAASHLTFQGGTCLRLCYGGNRYSEDLDFAGGRDFAPELLAGFSEILKDEIAAAYGLQVDVRTKADPLDGAGVQVARWQARIQVPQADPSVPQKQVINLEVATVPSHDPELVAVGANYPHLPAPFRSMILPAKSQAEILADKVVALGARRYLKHRDVWDIKLLTDRNVQLDVDLVVAKLRDYEVEPPRFRESLRERLDLLRGQTLLAPFQAEMSRFVDAPQAALLGRPELCRPFMARSASLIEQTLLMMQEPEPLQHLDDGPSLTEG